MKTIIFIAAVAALLAVAAAGPIKNETLIAQQVKNATLNLTKRATDVPKKNETVIGESKNATLNHNHTRRAAEISKKNETLSNETQNHNHAKRAAELPKKNETTNGTMNHGHAKRAAEIPKKNETLSNATLNHNHAMRAAELTKKNETTNGTMNHDRTKRSALEDPKKNETLSGESSKNATHAKVKLAAEVAKNETHLAEPKNNDTLSIFKRETPISKQCGIEDLNKIQGLLIAKLEKQIEKLLEKDVRRRRDSASAAGAGSEVGPDGKINSTAAANSKSGDPLPTPSPDAAPIPDADGARLHDSSKEPIDALVSGSDPTPGPLPAQPFASSTIPPPVPSGGVAAGLLAIVQNAKSHANMVNGTAVGSAIAKRATSDTIVQQVETSADKAVSTAEAHKGAGTTLQTGSAIGNALGIATAVVDAKNATGAKAGEDPKLTVQKLTATGDKAITSAANKKEGGTTVQDAISEGGSLAVSTVSTGGGDLVPVQDIKWPFRAKRGAGLCSDIKMNDQFRTLIRTTIENAFADIKHEMLAN